MEKCLRRTKEEPPASKLHGLLAKTTLSMPVAQLTDKSYLYLGKGGDFSEFHSSSQSLRYTSKAVILYWETIVSTPGDIFGCHN